MNEHYSVVTTQYTCKEETQWIFYEKQCELFQANRQSRLKRASESERWRYEEAKGEAGMHMYMK